MRKSISIWSFCGDWDLRQKMRLAKDSGFEGIEVELSREGLVSLSAVKDDLAKVRDLAAEIDIELSGLATGLYWEENPASQVREKRERAQQVLETQIRVAAMLEIDAILVVPGTVGADFIPNGEIVPYDLAWAHATEFVRGGVALAEEYGVTIGIENVWNKFLMSPLEMRRFVDQFDSNVGSYFDIGNVLATGYPEHWVSVLGERISRVHLKDYRRAVGTTDGFVDLLSGDVNWPAVIGALKSIGYDSWLTAEMIPPVPFYKYAPEILIDNTSRAMDSILEMNS